MTHTNTRHDDDWQNQDQYQETSGNDRYRNREYYSSERSGPSAANYPQYHAEHQHRPASEPHREYRDAPRGRPGPVDYRGNEARYAGPPPYLPHRFGGYDEVRHDSFGYTEVERQPYSFEPYLPYGPGGNATWRPRPGDFNQEYGDYGGPWNGQAYPRQAQQAGTTNGAGVRADSRVDSRADWRAVDDALYGGRYAGNHGGWQQDHHPHQAGEHHGHGQHVDPDYHQWRSEQIRNLDRDYDDWRRERYSKFSDDFNNWRSTRSGREQGLPSDKAVLPGTQSSGGTTASATTPHVPHQGTPGKNKT